MNREQAVHAVASYAAGMLRATEVDEIMSVGGLQATKEDLALLEEAQQVVVKRLAAMGKSMEIPDKPYRAVLTVNGRHTAHGPYQDEMNAVRAGKMWARRVLRTFPLGGPYPSVSVQAQRFDGEDWIDVGERVTDMTAAQ